MSRRRHPLIVLFSSEMKRRGFTAYRVAKESGLRISVVQSLLAGTVNPTLPTLEAVAEVLGLQVWAIRKR